MYFLNFSLKKFISTILLCFVLFGVFVQPVHAISNPNYDFLDGGDPKWIDYHYDMSFSDGNGKSLNLIGTLYPMYNSSVLGYVPYDVKLKNESMYKGLAGWNGVIFVDPKKLKPGLNKIMWADYSGFHDEEYITNKDKSMVGIDIVCGHNDLCTMNIYAGNDFSFPESYPWGFFRNKTYSSSMTIVKDFTINRSTDPDFVIFAKLETSKTYNEKSNMEESRIKVAVDVETTPGSKVFRKPTETTRITGKFPGPIGSEIYALNDNFELNFLDYTTAYSFSNKVLKDDLLKISNFISSSENQDLKENPYIYEEYFRNISLSAYGYFIELGFKQKLPTSQDLEDAGLGGNPNLFKDIELDKLKNGQTDFVFQECGNFEILCHIKNAVGYLVYKVGQIFSAMFNPLIGVIKNIWNGFADIIKGIFTWAWEGIKGFFEPIIKPIYDFFVNAHKIISENIADLQKISFTGTMETCREFNEINEKEATIASSLVNLISLAIPFAPADGGEVCTFDGRKIVDYKENTKFLDTILIMSAFMSIIFTFTSGISKHD